LGDLGLDDEILSFDYKSGSFFYDKVVFIHDHSKDYGKYVNKNAVF